MVKKIVVILLLSLIWWVATRSVFAPQLFHIHDYVHGARIAEMTRALEDGHFPVRWSQNFGFGFGMPLFEFYAPLPYYFGSLVYWLTGDLLWSVRSLFIAANLGTVIGAYVLGKRLFGRAAGLVTAAAFGLAPYRAVNLFVRGAVSEAWGMMFMPWVLLGGILLITRRRYGWLVLVVSLAGLMLSHNLTTLIFVPLSLVFLGGYWLWVQRKALRVRQSWVTIFRLAGAYLLAGGLAAFYMMPAFVEKDLTKIGSILSGYFDYHLHFLYIRQLITPYWGYGGSNWGPDDTLSFFLGWGSLVGLALLGVSFGWWWVSQVRQRTQSWWLSRQFWLTSLLSVLVASSLWMSLERALPIWEGVSFLAFIQFPWRWLGAATLFLALLISLSVVFIPRMIIRYVATLILVLIWVVSTWNYFVPETYLDQADGLYYSDPLRIQTHMSDVLPDYIPVQMADTIAEDPQPQTNLVLSNLPSEQAEVLVNRTHEKLVSLNLTEPQTIEFAMANFPGWQAQLNGQPVDIQTTELGTIAVTLPEKTHGLLGLKFINTPMRQMADLLSLTSLVVVLFLCLDPARINALLKTASPKK